MKSNRLAVCILCAIAAIVLFTGCEKAEAPDQVVKHYFETLASGEVLGVKPYVSPDAVLMQELVENNPDIIKAMPQIMEQQKKFWDGVTLAYSAPEGNTERMKVIVTAKYKDAQYSTTMILLSINGKWLISLYSVNSPEYMRFIQSIASAKNLVPVQEQETKAEIAPEKETVENPAPAAAETK